MTLTAAEQAAQTAGYTMPEGLDLISSGDDAIRANAVKAHAAVGAALTKIEQTRMTRGKPGDADAFTLEPGIHTISSSNNAARVANLPEEWAGQLFVITNEGETTKAILFYPYARDYYWLTVTRNSAGAMAPWRKFGDDPAVAYSQHHTRQTAFMHAMGGPIDTAGLGVAAWRIDHGLANFKTKLLPLFRAAGIVPMITYNPRDWSRPENEGVTAAELNQWVADGWVEIANHGAHHSAAETKSALDDTILNGLAEIEAELPAAAGKVWGFCPPGVSGDYMGFGTGSTPEQWDSYAGRLILTHHAVGYGYMPNTQMRVLDGTPRDGLNHVTIDAATVSAIKTRINEAISLRRGVQLMMHPSLLDTAGYITTAQVGQVIDYLVQQRDQSKIKTLSSYQMMIADSTRPPVPHTHTVAEVTGLAARLAILEPKELGTAHLDSVITPGRYYQQFASRSTKAQGYPWEGVAGNLEIELWNPTNGNLIVTFKSWDRGTAKRTYYLGTWRPWLDTNGNPIP